MHLDLSNMLLFNNHATSKLCLFLIVLFFLNWKLLIADNSETNVKNTPLNIAEDTLNYKNYIITNFNKYINLFQLQVEGKAFLETEYGNISLRQHYNGNYLKLSDLSSRDDQNWQITYKKPIYGRMGIIANQNLIFVSDSRNIGINQLSRINGAVGLEYSDEDYYKLSAVAGIENNKLLGINSQGQLLSVKAGWKDVSMDNVSTSGDLSGNWLKLNLDRLDRDLLAKINLFGRFSDDALLQSSIEYKFLQNNLLWVASNKDFIPIETRMENFVNPKILIDYSLSERLALFLDLSLNSNNITRQFKQSWQEFDYSYFQRNIDQMDISINSGMNWRWGILTHFVAVGFWSRSESNTLQLADMNYSGDLLKYQNIENQRDYQTDKLNLLNQVNFQLSTNTNLAFNYNVYLLQYDTPSKQNFDDRDEFNSIFRAIFNHRLSQYTSVELSFENIQNHLVYLFSQRSIMNNWNKVYRLSPSVKYKNNFFQINPKIEVLANYTIYDFSSKSSATKSISLRNLSYRDSILINFTQNIESRTQFKYQISERSLLNWHEFSEYPQIRINEIFIKSLLIRKYDYGEIGIGFNMFDYKQYKIQENFVDYDIMSISPEVLVAYRYLEWQLKFSGWYEFQYQNANKINEIANINLTINMFFD